MRFLTTNLKAILSRTLILLLVLLSCRGGSVIANAPFPQASNDLQADCLLPCCAETVPEPQEDSKPTCPCQDSCPGCPCASCPGLIDAFCTSTDACPIHELLASRQPASANQCADPRKDKPPLPPPRQDSSSKVQRSNSMNPNSNLQYNENTVPYSHGRCGLHDPASSSAPAQRG